MENTQRTVNQVRRDIESGACFPASHKILTFTQKNLYIG